MLPGALSPEELQELPGFGKDHEANLKEAKRLLAEAGYANGFKTVLTNRSIKLPYIDMGVYLLSAWKKVGIEAEHRLEESATWSKSRANRDFELLLDPIGFAAVADPDETPGQVCHRRFQKTGAAFSDPVVDKLFEQQKVELDEQKRIQLVRDMQKEIMKKAWWLPGLWWSRARGAVGTHPQLRTPCPTTG